MRSVMIQPVSRSAAYSKGATALLLSILVILGALAFEHLGGYAPCALCLQQRTAYYVAIPTLFVALALVAAGRPKSGGLLFLAVSVAFLANAGLGVYHAGAEWKFWPGPDTCGGGAGITGSASDLLKNLARTSVVRCDEPALTLFGLSLAGWNVVASAILFITSLQAAFLSSSRAP